eukprot:2841608-Prymnesium_polylepis.1
MCRRATATTRSQALGLGHEVLELCSSSRPSAALTRRSAQAHGERSGHKLSKRQYDETTWSAR